LAAKYEGTLPAEGTLVRWTDTTTVNDAITAWKQNGWQDLSPTTVRHYQELWDKHIKRSIGRREIAQLNPYEVERYFRRLKDDGTGRTPCATFGRCSTVHAGWPGSERQQSPQSDRRH